MTTPALRGWITLVAVLALGGCNKNAKSETAPNADHGEPVRVLDAGAEPKISLRYTIADGTVTKSNMDFKLATLAQTSDSAALSVLPGVRLHIVSGPSMQTDAGLKFPVDIEKAEPMIPAGIDEAIAEDLRRSAGILDEVGGVVVMDDRGLVRSVELNQRAKNPDIPLRLLTLIVNARTTLARVVLPPEPVGIGARWEVQKELVLYGFKIQQVDTFTLVEKVGDELKLNVIVTQNALPQTVDFPEERVSISVDSINANANGQVILNLNALESDAAASGSSTDKFTVTSEEGVTPVDVAETFEVRLTNTTRLQ